MYVDEKYVPTALSGINISIIWLKGLMRKNERGERHDRISESNPT